MRISRPVLFTILMSLIPAAGLAQDMRDVTGQVMVLERMALPDDTVLIVDVTDAQDNRVTESRALTGGQQSPFAFSVALAPDTPFILRAGLRGPGDAVWLSEPVAVQPGDGPLDLGTLRAQRVPLMGFVTLMMCGNQFAELGIIPEGVRVRFNEQVLTMMPQEAASGALYVDPDNPATQIHTRGDRAMLRIDGSDLAECMLLSPAADITAGVWNISEIGGKAAIFPSRTELVFFPDGRVAASVGCNRMIGGYRRHGGVLSFGAIASTRMGCPDGIGEQEAAFAAALMGVDGFQLGQDGTRLTLTAAGQPVIQARR